MYAPVAHVVRSGVVESVHHGAAVALDAEGRLAFSAGDPDVAVYPRSANKPLQAVAMLRSGLEVADDELAVVCASHDGSPRHVEVVRRVLARAGLDEAALGNVESLPYDQHEAAEVLRAGGVRRAITMNCSGKHAGMVATCVVAGWPADRSYLDPDHPLQVAITDTLAELAGARPSHVGVDGCGAPAHVLTLVELARAVRAIAAGGAGEEGRRVHHAMMTHPELVGGPARDVTVLMQRVPGLLAKDGAEGVMVAALPDGRAAAVKVADGGDRARPVVMLAALAALGVPVEPVDGPLAPLVYGGGRPVGRVEPAGSVATWTVTR